MARPQGLGELRPLLGYDEVHRPAAQRAGHDLDAVEHPVRVVETQREVLLAVRFALGEVDDHGGAPAVLQHGPDLHGEREAGTAPPAQVGRLQQRDQRGAGQRASGPADARWGGLVHRGGEEGVR